MNFSNMKIPDAEMCYCLHFFQVCCTVLPNYVSIVFLQKSEGGLFVDMNSFLAFGKEFVSWNYEKSGNPVYLHIKETQKLVSEDRPSKKPTLLAIGNA